MPHGQAAQIHGKKILLWRLENGLTLRDLAARCAEAGEPANFSNLSRIERGLNHPRPRLLRVLAKVLDIEVKDLVKWDEAA